jgi:hypothetical protein
MIAIQVRMPIARGVKSPADLLRKTDMLCQPFFVRATRTTSCGFEMGEAVSQEGFHQRKRVTISSHHYE